MSKARQRNSKGGKGELLIETKTSKRMVIVIIAENFFYWLGYTCFKQINKLDNTGIINIKNKHVCT